jgi:arylsulfatase A-like enzyme
MRLLLLLLVASTLRLAAAAPPNLVLILVDDLGVMDTSLPFLTDASGKPEVHPLNRFYHTPHLERLAAQGIRFSQFNAMSVCSPTRTTLLTGQNAARHHVTNWINPERNNAGPKGASDWRWRGLGPGDVTLPGLLRAAGYRTLHVGKGHFGPTGSPGADPTQLGFEVNIGGSSHGQPGSYHGAKSFGHQGPRAARGVPHLEKYHGQEIFLTEAITRETLPLLDTAVREGKPFFLYFAHFAVHGPFESDPRFAARYKESGKPAPAQAYATLVEGMDQSVGDLLAHLDQLGVAENTLVIFLGDNGGDAPLGGPHEVACAAPLRGKKGSHYEGGVRVPFIAAWAKPNSAHPAQARLPIAAGGVQTRLASVCDLFPTLLNAAGVAPPAGHPVDGHPLQGLLTGGEDPGRRDEFLLHYPHGLHRSSYFTTLRRGAWKVAYHYFPGKDSGGRAYQLFNLQEDPYEQQDLAEREPTVLKEMMTALAAALEAHGAQYPQEDGRAVKPVLP